MTEVETLDLLTGLLTRRERFVHVRFGDGDVFFASGTGPKLTADGEEWTPLLQQRLLYAWLTLARHPDRLLVGDVASYDVSDGCEREWDVLRTLADWLRPDGQLELVHIEALRAGRRLALPFYRTVTSDSRRKALVAPERLSGAAAMLDADHVTVPLGVSHGEHVVADTVEAVAGYDVVLFAAGRGGKLMQADLSCWAPGVTQVDIGSGLDLLFDGVRRGTDAGVDVEALRGEYRAAGLTL